MKKHNPSHPFTLLEVMVAAAVLVIMMSFIFQFTNSAQHLWKTNTGRTEMSDAMDIVFTLLNDDLENMYVVSPEEDLDAQAGWYCMHGKASEPNYPFANVPGYNLKDFCFFTQDRGGSETASNSMIHPVRYHYRQLTDPENPEIGVSKLYRFEAQAKTWDKIADGFKDSGRGNDPDWYVPLEKYATGDDIPDGYSAGDIKWPLYDEENLVAENLQSVQIFSTAAIDPETGDKLEAHKVPLMEIPQGITVTLVTSVPKNLRGNQKKVTDDGGEVLQTTDRAMSRFYLLR